MALFFTQSFNMVHPKNQQQFSRMLGMGGSDGSPAVWGNGVIEASEEWGILFFTILTSKHFLVFWSLNKLH